jgi:hypothetical protein
MVARNNITGDKLQSKKNSSEYEDNWELIWGKNKVPNFTEDELMNMEVIQDMIDNPKKKTHDILRPTTKWEGDCIQTDWDESRIDTIGQNGNEGDHYDQVEGLGSTTNKPVEPA